MTSPLLKRFLAKVRKPAEADGCWIWIGHKNSKGYGGIKIGRIKHKAHRVAYVLFIDLIPKGLCILHHCDNPSCVNPNHLFLGTHADNAADMIAKGRCPRGIAHYRSKFDAQQVIAIRRAVSSGVSQAAVARRYGVNHNTIHLIVHGRNWAHLKDRAP